MTTGAAHNKGKQLPVGIVELLLDLAGHCLYFVMLLDLKADSSYTIQAVQNLQSAGKLVLCRFNVFVT